MLIPPKKRKSRRRGWSYCFFVPDDLLELAEGRLLLAEDREELPLERLRLADGRDEDPPERLLPTDERERLPVEPLEVLAEGRELLPVDREPLIVRDDGAEEYPRGLPVNDREPERGTLDVAGGRL